MVGKIDRQTYCRVRDAADVLHVTERTILMWIQRGIIRGVKMGGTWIVERASLVRD